MTVFCDEWRSIPIFRHSSRFEDWRNVMWYVMQVRTGKEEETISMVRQYTTGSHMGECFLPRYEQKKKYAGAWHLVQALLFPGYVFVETEEIEKFYMGLKQVPSLTKVLGTGERWTSIIDEDLKVLERLLNKRRLVEMSTGCIEGDQVVIVDGPLKGLETVVRKINRHKKTALVEMHMFGRRQDVAVGLEIVSRV